MKAAILASPFAVFTACALVSCENPVDKTTDAEVGEAVEKEEIEAPEGAVKYVFTDASTIGFTGSKVTGAHDGGFKNFTGHFTLVAKPE